MGQERDELLRYLSENLDDVVWVNDPDGEVVFVSAAYEDIWGRPPEELVGRPSTYVEHVHPEDRERVREAQTHKWDDPDSYDEVYRVRQPDGDIRWVHDRGFGVYENGELTRFVGIARDVTERKQREQDLQNERDLVERILETSTVGIVVYGSDGQVVRANDQAARLLGVDHSTLVGSGPVPADVDIFSRDGRTLDAESLPFERIQRTGESVRNEEVVVETPSGDRSVFVIDGVPLFEEGDLRRVVVTLDDVTERVDREQRLKAQRNELAQLDRINRIIRDVDAALLGATSREEIAQAVCDKLSKSGRYRYTVFLRRVGETRFEPQAAPDDASFVEHAFPIAGVTHETCPATRALVTGTVQTIQDVQTSGESPMATWVETVRNAGIQSMAAIPVAYEGREYGVITVYVPKRDAFSERELEVLDELGETVGYAIAAVESREREAILASLYEATQDLLGAETAQEVSEVVVTTASDVLDPPGIGLFLFDDDENVLRPATTTGRLLEFYDGSTVFGPGKHDSEVWRTYVTGEETFFADIREAEHVANPATEARSTLMLPLGDHGVFVVASTETETFDEQIRRLIGLLAATTEAALDRVVGKAGIRERDEQLEKRRARLERFEGMFSLIERVDGLLRQAGTREEIERGVCEELIERDFFSFAWIGAVPPDGTTVKPRAWAGTEDGYLDAVSLALDTGESTSGPVPSTGSVEVATGVTEPATETAATGEPTVVTNVTDHLREADWAREAVTRDYQSVLAVPLVYGDATYGVLTIYGDEPDAFGDIVKPVLTTLGATIAHSINTVETKRGILAEQVVELELSIADPGTFLNAVSEVVGSEVGYREITPETDGSARVLFGLPDPPVEEVLALEGEYVSVESLTHVEQGDEHLFRATLSGPTVAATLLDCGSIPQAVVSNIDETTAVVQVPRELDVRTFLDRVRRKYPDTELVSRRDVERGGTREDVRAALEEDLTDRQREVLVTAYESGFFQSPRETSGAELAELLNVSQPTVTHHLREAQRRLFAALFDDAES